MKTSIRLAKGLRLFRTTYRGAQGERHTSGNWWIEFRDQHRTIRRLPAFADQAQSGELARKVVRLVNWRASGEIPDLTLQRWVETMPDKMRETLARWDILDARRIAASKQLSEHLDDWKMALLFKGNTARHAELVTGRARKLIEGCGFKAWSEISASKVQSHLADLRQDHKEGEQKVRGLGAQTSNFYLQAVQQFCRWLAKDRRASESPLAHLDGLNVKTDRRHDRRALAADELRWLLAVTERGFSKPGPDGKPAAIVHATHRFGMTGPERAMLYRLAVETGLRAGELRSLTRASFQLDGDGPTVTIAAAYAKNRRQDTLPLRPEIAPLLVDRLRHKLPDAKAFNMPTRTEVIRMFRADLADARTAWLESHQNAQERTEAAKSAFLLPVDEAGRHADFHALRHSFISNLAAGGVHPKTAQQLARHSTITLTMDRYTHSYRGEMSAALNVLPDLSKPIQANAVAMTGTDATTSNSSDRRLARSLAHFDGGSGDERLQRRLMEPENNEITASTKQADSLEKSQELTLAPPSDNVGPMIWRGGRAVECAGFENR